MKSFKRYIKELHMVNHHRFQCDEYGVDSDTGMSAGDVIKCRYIRALNAYIGAIANMEYMLPEHALRIMREKV